MPLYLYERKNGVYFIRGSVQGQRFDQSTRTRVRAEAEAIRAHLESDAFKRAVYGDKSVATFAEAADGYMASGGSTDHMMPLLLKLGNTKLADINQALVDKLAREMKPNAKPATVVRQVYTPISAVMNFAAEQRLCEFMRFRKPKIRNARTEFLTPAQVTDWLAVLPDHLKRLVAFYVATGCRATEALDLQWKDVSPAGERVVFWETKGGYARGCQLQAKARGLLPERGEGAVFRNSRGEAWHSYDAINLMLKRYRLKHPHLAPAHCHLFRHTWATWSYAVHKDLTRLMGQGGWRSATMVMRYTHAGSPDLAAAVKKAGWEIYGSIGLATSKKRVESKAL